MFATAVIDVGAAPGAWTVLLSKRAGRVLAIDPAPLSTAALSLPNVTHVKSKVRERVCHTERCIDELQLSAQDCSKTVTCLSLLASKMSLLLHTCCRSRMQPRRC